MIARHCRPQTQAWLALLTAFTLGGCAPRTVRHALTLGTERVTVETPVGWEMVDRGDAVILRQADMELRIETIGAVGPVGILREVERARQLSRQGRDKEARWRLRRVRVPDELFATTAQREAFWAAWHEVLDENTGYITETAFENVLANVAKLTPMEPDALADAWLAQDDSGRRRDLAARDHRMADGRPTVVLDTWNRFDHTDRQRIALVFDSGYALALRTSQGAFGPGPFAPQALVLEMLLVSLRFDPAAR